MPAGLLQTASAAKAATTSATPATCRAIGPWPTTEIRRRAHPRPQGRARYLVRRFGVRLPRSLRCPMGASSPAGMITTRISGRRPGMAAPGCSGSMPPAPKSAAKSKPTMQVLRAARTGDDIVGDKLVLVGTDARDFLFGKGGNDQLSGSLAGDLLDGFLRPRLTPPRCQLTPFSGKYRYLRVGISWGANSCGNTCGRRACGAGRRSRSCL